MPRPLLSLLLLAMPALAQSVVTSERPVSPQEWARLRQVVENLRTEESTRKFYRETPGLQEAYPAEPFFLSYVQKWRSRLEPLPRDRAAATQVSLTLKELEDGGEDWFLTLHHTKPKFAITVIKTSWKDGALKNLTFTRGFTEVSGARK